MRTVITAPKGLHSSAKTGNRADRESLRAAMLDQGRRIEKTATEIRIRWAFALRVAYRHGWRCVLWSVLSALDLAHLHWQVGYWVNQALNRPIAYPDLAR